jgi:glycosyltransferase involved in cell wall biosynthesis
MRILFFADGRSPIALNWIRFFCEAGDEVHLVSLYPCQPQLPLASLRILRLPYLAAQSAETAGSQSWARRFLPVRVRTAIRQRFVPLGIPSAASRFRVWVDEIQPQLVHAMRIPYEGMVAALAGLTAPLLLSVWGNDFTLHAPATRQMSALTRQAMDKAKALHTDCERDLRLAFAWGFEPHKPSAVLPGAGGVRTDIFTPPQTTAREKTPPILINPRGIRAYVRNDTFFQAVTLVREKHPFLRVLCPAMAGEKQALAWVREYGLEEVVELLPRQTAETMAELYRRAWVSVSLTEHDGTPNTLLEAMACGCFPVAGDIESLREWITPGVNGLLAPPADAHRAAEAILAGLENSGLRRRAAEINVRLITERAEYGKVMEQAREWYRRLIASTS